jgi:antitoxin (DNA-binding transcriptional repressor) of toxin-antitoxin stability system
MIAAGIRELKNQLSHYVRRVERGERIAVTAHGRVVAELARPVGDVGRNDPLANLFAKGLARPPIEDGDPLEGWPTFRLPAGTAKALLDAERGEA